MSRAWLLRVIAAWLIMAVVMTANGIFRETVLRGTLPARADVLSAVIGAVLILVSTKLVFGPVQSLGTSELFFASALLIGLTILFEFTLGRLVDHKSWQELLENYALWKGHLWPLLLLLVGVSPFLWIRWF
jgi:hypothetical protein